MILIRTFIIGLTVLWPVFTADAQLPNAAFFAKSFKPNAFSFTGQTGVALNTVTASNSVTLTGIGTRAVTATCSGCTLERNTSGSWAASAGGFRKGDTIRIRLTSSGSNGTAVTASVTVGTVASSLWSVTTLAVVTGVTPGTGSIAGATGITITGAGFVNGATVSIDNVSATGVTWNSATQLTATTPAGASSGAKDVKVTNPDGGYGVLSGGFTYGPTSQLGVWYTVPAGSSYYYAPSGAATIRITIVAAGQNFSGENTSQAGGGGGCADIYLSVNQSNGFLPGEQFQLQFDNYSGTRWSAYTSYVQRPRLDGANYLAYANTGQNGAGGAAGTQVSLGNGFTGNFYSGGNGGGAQVVVNSYVQTGGGGGGAGPGGNGGSGAYAGGAGAGGVGNSSLPGSSGGGGGNGVYVPWENQVNGGPGSSYGGGGGGQGWGGSSAPGGWFFRIYAQ